MPETVYSVVDVETTGLRPSDRIVEVAIRLANGQGRLLSTFESVVDPQRRPGPTWLHGLTAEHCRQAPSFWELAGEIHRRLVGTVLVAHHLRFDWGFLRREFARCDVTFLRQPAGICTSRCSRARGLRGDLQGAAAAMGLRRTRRHSAAADAATAHELWQELQRTGASMDAGVPLEPGHGAHRLPAGGVAFARRPLSDLEDGVTSKAAR